MLRIQLTALCHHFLNLALQSIHTPIVYPPHQSLAVQFDSTSIEQHANETCAGVDTLLRRCTRCLDGEILVSILTAVDAHGAVERMNQLDLRSIEWEYGHSMWDRSAMFVELYKWCDRSDLRIRRRRLYQYKVTECGFAWWFIFVIGILRGDTIELFNWKVEAWLRGRRQIRRLPRLSEVGSLIIVNLYLPAILSRGRRLP